MDVAARKQVRKLSNQAPSGVKLSPVQDETSDWYINERYRLVLEQTGASVFEWNLETGTFYCTESYEAYEMSALSAEDILNNTGSLDVVHPDDIPILLDFFVQTKSSQEKAEAVMRLRMKDGTFRWSKLVGIFVQKRVIGAIIDLHEERENSNMLSSIFNTIPGGVGMYRLDDIPTPLYFNDRVAEMCGMTREEYLEAIKEGFQGVVHPDDYASLVSEVGRSIEAKSPVTLTYRTMQKQGGYRWSHMSGTLMPESEGYPVLCAVFTDIHDRVLTEQALKANEIRYQLAVKAAGINIFEYDIIRDELQIVSSASRNREGSWRIEHFSTTVLAGDTIREDSRKTFRVLIEKLRSGVESVSGDIWIKLPHSKDFWCEQVTCSLIENDDCGKPSKAYGVGNDVTREKEVERRYRYELACREAMQTAVIASVNINLSQNTILDYKSDFVDIMDDLKQTSSAQDYFDSIYAQMKNDLMRKRCREILDVNCLIKRYNLGDTSLSAELVRTMGDKFYWTTVHVYMMRQPQSDEVVAFVYSVDITNEKVMQSIMNTVVRTDYDYLVVVDGLRNSATRYSDNGLTGDYAQTSDDFEAQTREYLRNQLRSEEVERVLEKFTLRNILAELDESDSYSLYYSIRDARGQFCRKQLRFTYMDKEFKVFLMTRTDITMVYEEQERRNDQLAQALDLAKQANLIKSEFLSRISHEIRTPMNAIMGMAEIAASRVDDSAFVMDCIEKAQEASRYLLSLINDLLDMSRIESGKVQLDQEAFSSKALFESVNTMVQAQATIEGITYLPQYDTSIAPVYWGDETRVKQILINILNNAVKFTPAGGVVKFVVSQEEMDEGRAMLRCVVSDTGIGISPEFLPRLFEPFMRDDNQTTSRYGGSGLGLSIARNLARIMKGDITVSSKLGEGTTFFVTLELGVADEGNVKGVDLHQVNEADYDFSGKKVLLCEDHPLNTMVATKLLENKGFRVVCAESGKVGLEIFLQSTPGEFDIILMDIRMPELDGLETTEMIRRLSRSDAQLIPIVAMTANAYPEDINKSRQAGMDGHLSKPIEPQRLFRLLHGLLSRRRR
ncbi:MAG: ATP-binding protein [Gordonibacter sp.]|nr:ATP-binding protein [Gordonibacter sp.]